MSNRNGIPFVGMVMAATLGFGGVYAVTAPDAAAIAQSGLAAIGIGCPIKGNVSFATGERIYHLPGQPRYAETRIRPEWGERYFCTESEARAAGWRPARG